MESKTEIYKRTVTELNALLASETNEVLKMSTISCVLNTNFKHFFWVGFYQFYENQLHVGPYQGTLGCLHIPLNKGVCGRAATQLKTQIVDDVHADPAHIACDAATNSEIVIPVFNQKNELIAVLDVDSTEKSMFDDTDQKYLELIVHNHFSV